jgi:hypothetical protein
LADAAAVVPVVAAAVPDVAAVVAAGAAAVPVVGGVATVPEAAAIESVVDASVPVIAGAGEAADAATAGVAEAVALSASGDFEHEQIRITQIAAKNALMVISRFGFFRILGCSFLG